METYLKLRRRQQKFVDAIVAGKNGADAVRSMGFKGSRPDQVAWKLKQDPKIAEAIAERRREAIESSGVQLQRVLEELARVAFFDPRKLFSDAGSILPITEWPPEVAAAIAGIDVESLFEGSGKGRTRIGDILKYRAWPKIDALKMLLQHLGGLTEKHELTGPGGGPIQSVGITTDDPVEAGRQYLRMIHGKD